MQEQAERLLSALQALSPDIQQIMILHYAHERTFEQIAEQLNISPSTCQRSWIKGCEALRQQLVNLL